MDKISYLINKSTPLTMLRIKNKPNIDPEFEKILSEIPWDALLIHKLNGSAAKNVIGY